MVSNLSEVGERVRILITGWPSFRQGTATAGDVAAMRRVANELTAEGILFRIAWNPVFAPESLSLDEASPDDYTHVVFVCGTLHGDQIRELHRRYAGCYRIAVGVSVVDNDDPSVTGFHAVLPRDAPGAKPARDLASSSGPAISPVAGIVFAPGQPEYGDAHKGDAVHARLTTWLANRDCAPMILDSRLNPTDWRLCSTTDQFTAQLSRADIILTSRLHGLVLGLEREVPVLAIDPIEGGGKVSAQARAWQWPAILGLRTMCDAERTAFEELDRWWDWCLSSEARALAHRRAMAARADASMVRELVDKLR